MIAGGSMRIPCDKSTIIQVAGCGHCLDMAYITTRSRSSHRGKAEVGQGAARCGYQIMQIKAQSLQKRLAA